MSYTPKRYATNTGKTGTRNLAPDAMNHRSVCDRMMDTISENTGVICECRLMHGNLFITARSYADYVLARQIAVEDFFFNSANVSYQQQASAPGLAKVISNDLDKIEGKIRDKKQQFATTPA